MPTQRTLRGGFNGTDYGIISEDSVRNPTIIEGGGPLVNGLGSCIGVVANATGVVISGLRLQDGSGYHFPDGSTAGGGLYGDSNAAFNVEQCTFLNNHSAGSSSGSLPTNGYGGGAYYPGSSPVGFVNCTFTGNDAPNGGGLCLEGTGKPLVTGCVITGNVASASSAGTRQGLGGARTLRWTERPWRTPRCTGPAQTLPFHPSLSGNAFAGPQGLMTRTFQAGPMPSALSGMSELSVVSMTQWPLKS